MTTKGKRIKERHDGSTVNIQSVGTSSAFFGLMIFPRHSNVARRGYGTRRATRR